jgi:hypothetical protein
MIGNCHEQFIPEMFDPRGTIPVMPKRKTADVNVEQASAPEPTKRSSATKPKTAAAATHKRTPRKANAEATPVVSAFTVESAPGIPAALPAVATPALPSHEAIALRAYLYAEARGFQSGSPEEDWLRAERELMKLAQDR